MAPQQNLIGSIDIGLGTTARGLAEQVDRVRRLSANSAHARLAWERLDPATVSASVSGAQAFATEDAGLAGQGDAQEQRHHNGQQ